MAIIMDRNDDNYRYILQCAPKFELFSNRLRVTKSMISLRKTSRDRRISRMCCDGSGCLRRLALYPDTWAFLASDDRWRQRSAAY